MSEFLGVIPARYASSRFPGKPLVMIGNRSMIQRVYERSLEVLEQVVVATDDKRIFEAVRRFGGQVVMTSENHPSGTDRCMEAMNLYSAERGENFNIIINIQGDEPFIQAGQIRLLKECFQDADTQIATLIKKITDREVLTDPNRPKVVTNHKGQALYFSRSAIPFMRNAQTNDWTSEFTFYQHIGMYAYKKEILEKITKLPVGILEKAESLEQLRWLENGFSISTAITPFDTYGIDTPADLEKALLQGLAD